MTQIRELTSSSEVRSFIDFEFTLMQDNPYWVPPLVREELEVFDRNKNPAFNYADARLFMAYKEGEPVGRVAAIVNRFEVNQQEKSKLRFGWFDTINDPEVAKRLMEKLKEIGREWGLRYMEGPVGFTNMDKAGMLVEGFEELNTMATWYNPPYYPELMEQLGFEKEKEWVEYKIKIPDEGPSEKIERFSNLILERNDLHVVHFKNKRQIIERADEMFELINQTYSGLSTFVPIQPEQIAYYKQKYFRYLHPDFISCVADRDDRLVAFAITMPSFARALQKAGGRLFPLGWLHLLKARYFNERAAFYLIGIRPEYQNKGITATIFKEMNDTFNRRGITEVETNPELEENKAVQALWKRYENEQHKRRRTYRKPLD